MALRAALIWHDEVMSDVVVDKPARLTIGSSAGSTFVVPDIGLPSDFAIVSPGQRGYLLTLGGRMSGTICVDGAERGVSELVGGEPFHATPIGGVDWGLVDLDPSGAYKLFFQFVDVEDAAPWVTRPVLIAGSIGFGLASLIMTLAWAWHGVDVDEAVFRGVGLSAISLVIAGTGWSILRQDSESKASLAFSVVLHAAILFMTYQLYDHGDPLAWSTSDLAEHYIATRLDVPKPQPAAAMPKPSETQAPATIPTTLPPTRPLPISSSTGRGHSDRHHDTPHGIEGAVASVMQGVTGPTGIPGLDHVRITHDPGSFGNTTRDGHGDGPSDGNGDGDHKGPPGPGHTPGVTLQPDRKAGCFGPGCKGPQEKHVGRVSELPPEVPEGLDRAAIKRVVESRRGAFQACYQRVLDHRPGLGGKVVTRFVIDGDGHVTRATLPDNGLHDDDVGDCIIRNLMHLQFPPKPPGGIVIYPFVFSPGGS
jgi:hypothetical protein